MLSGLPTEALPIKEWPRQSLLLWPSAKTEFITLLLYIFYDCEFARKL